MYAQIGSRRRRRPVNELDRPALHRTAPTTKGTARSAYRGIRRPVRGSGLDSIHSSLGPLYLRYTIRLRRFALRLEDELRSGAATVVIRYLSLRAIRDARLIGEV